MVVGADVGEIRIDLFRSLTERARKLTGCVPGALGIFGVDDIGNGLGRGEGKPPVQKGALGKLAGQSLSCTERKDLVEQRAQHDRGAVALKLGRVLARIAVRRTADRAQTQIEQRAAPVMRTAVYQLVRRALGHGFAGLRREERIGDLDRPLAGEAHDPDRGDLGAGGDGSYRIRHGHAPPQAF